MHSKRRVISRFTSLADVFLSGATLCYTRSLEPVWWIAWLAAVPLLVLAPRVFAFAAFGASALEWGVDGPDPRAYYRQLGFPLWLIFLVLLLPALAFGLVTLLYRSFLRGGRPALAVVSVPCLWVAHEIRRPATRAGRGFRARCLVQPVT